jgi:anti-anti-sigma factor
MSQTLVISESDAGRSKALPDALVHLWEDRGTDVAWVRVVGELDIATAPALEQALRSAELRARLVMLDLRELTFTDSCGVNVISAASDRARGAGRRLVLVRGPTQADRMFALMTSDALEIVDLDPDEPVVEGPPQLPLGPGGPDLIAASDHDTELTVAVSAAMVELHAAFYGLDHVTATTYINDKIVVCVLENTLTQREQMTVPEGAGEAIDGRVAFLTATEDEFCAAIERLTHRRVVAFMSQDQATPGVAHELFFLDAAPRAGEAESQA